MSLKPFSESIDVELKETQESFVEPQNKSKDLKPFSEDIYGGPGSGHYGHEGRPGKVGGSQPDGEARKKYVSPTKKAAIEMEREYKRLVEKKGKGHLEGLGFQIGKVGKKWELVKKTPAKIPQKGPEGWLDEKPEKIKEAYLRTMDKLNVSEREVHNAVGAWKAGDEDLTEKQKKIIETAFPEVEDPEGLPSFFPIRRTQTIAEPLKKQR